MGPGSTRIHCELPCSADQLVGMVHGLATALFHTARRLVPDPEPVDASTLVLFGADPAIEMKSVRRVGVFKLSVLQAITPISLCVLLHELGHWVLRQLHPPQQQLAWQEAVCGLAERMVPHAREERLDTHRRATARIETFLEDVFAHAVWRVIGCSDDFGRFRTQFLAGQSMGLRTQADPRSPRVAIESWADVLLHLWAQRWLHDHDEDVSGLLDALVSLVDLEAEEPDAPLRAAMRSVAGQAAAFWRAEIELAARRLSTPPDDDALTESVVSTIGHLWVGPLAEWGIVRAAGQDADYQRQLVGLWRFLRSAATELELTHDALVARCRAYAGLAAAVRRGTEAPSPPWELLDADGAPTLDALLWAREILGAVADAFWAQVGPRLARDRAAGGPAPAVGIRRQLDGDVDLSSYPGRAPEGLFTDLRGGVFVAGRSARDAYHASRAAAIEALLELAGRVRCGRIHRHFRRGRAFPRFEAEPGRQALVRRLFPESEDPPLNLDVHDISSGGLCLFQPDSATALTTGDRVTVLGRHGEELEAKVLDERPPLDGRRRVALEMDGWHPVHAHRDWLAASA